MSSETIESAIELALLAKASLFATAQSLTLDFANGKSFTPPASSPAAQWLRATVLPAPTMTAGIAFNSFNQHYGILQIDIMQGLGGGSVPMKRQVAALSAYFPMGLTLTNNGFDIRIISHTRNQVVTAGPMMFDSAAWMKIPVSIPYRCFERPA